MRNPGGYIVITDPEAPTVEHDTFTCSHCNRIVIVQAKASPDEFGSMCRVCMKMVCQRCSGKGCIPFLKKVEEDEKRQRMLKAIGI